MNSVPGSDRSIWRSSAIILGVRGLSIGAQLAALVVIARAVTIAEFGQFAVASAIWVLARALAPLGSDIAVLKLGAIDWRKNGGERTLDLLRTSERQTLRVVASLGAITLLTAWLWRGALSWDIALAVLVGATWALVAPVISTLRAVDHVIVGQVIDGLGIYTLPLGILVFVSATSSLTLTAVYMAYAAGAAVTLLMGALIVWRRLASATRRTYADTRGMLRLSLRFWQTQVVLALATRAPVLLSGAIGGLPQAAIVEVAYKPQIVSSTVAWAIGTNASPRYARRPNLVAAMPHLRFSTLATAVATSLLLAAVAAGGPQVLALMGAEYAAAYGPMLVMISAGILEAPALAAGYFFAMAGHERTAIRITSIQFASLVLSLVVLLPLLGPLGAGLALVVSSTVRSALSFAVLRRLASREPGVAAHEVFWKARGNLHGGP